MRLIWWLLASRGSPVDPGPLTISKMRLLASGGSLVDRKMRLVAFGLSGLPGRPGSPYYKQNAFDLAAFGFWGLPGRP